MKHVVHNISNNIAKKKVSKTGGCDKFQNFESSSKAKGTQIEAVVLLHSLCHVGLTASIDANLSLRSN
jgi:hypothetical protein